MLVFSQFLIFRLFFFALHRNLSADVTRFLPSTLRVKRDDNRKQQQKPKQYITEVKQPEASKTTTTKDDAYMQFMREMQGLI